MSEIQPQTQTRPLYDIAREIRRVWVDKDGLPNVNYAAVPYLEAMESLSSINDRYFEDTAATVVNYFLSNARTLPGEDGKRIKAELKGLVGRK